MSSSDMDSDFTGLVLTCSTFVLQTQLVGFRFVR